MNISNENREHIFNEFYKLNSSNDKHAFISSTTCYGDVKRRREVKGKESTCEPKRKQSSIAYYFTVNGKNIRVCKSYYLGTFAVSQKMVYNVHTKKDLVSSVVKPDGRGRHGNNIKFPKGTMKLLFNKNQGMSQAVIEFMSRNQHIKTVNMKYLIPGHSGVQEVDSMHS